VLDGMLAQYGAVESCEQVVQRGKFNLTGAMEKLNGSMMENYALKVSYIPDETAAPEGPPLGGRRGFNARGPPRSGSPGLGARPKVQSDIPLRVLVPTQFTAIQALPSVVALLQHSSVYLTSTVKLQDLTLYNPERTITVKGSIDACSRAEEEVMKKIRESYESDMAAMN
ncbi:hypothetical protein XENOCAPTIV_002245, partial [Xenoophorus captivus]